MADAAAWEFARSVGFNPEKLAVKPDYGWNPALHATWCPQHYPPPADGGGSSWLCCCPYMAERTLAERDVDDDGTDSGTPDVRQRGTAVPSPSSRSASARVAATPEEEAAAEMCRCGHARDRHWMGFGEPGTCSVSIDTRPVTAGGSDLHPCPCKGFVPFDAFGRVSGAEKDTA